MGKVKSQPKATAPDSLTLRLAGPGMGPLHRAGLGGLAATLAAWEDQFTGNSNWPPLPNGTATPPWTITPTEIVLDFGKPENAASFLKALFARAFDTTRKNGLIYLPGQHAGLADRAVLARMQSALTMTFLQHGKSRTLVGDAVTFSQDVGDEQAVEYSYKPCTWFKHQDGWKDLVDGDTLADKTAEVVGPLNPGAAVRHVAFSGATRIEETPGRLLPLYFAPVGCVALSDGHGAGVLLVPEVEDLVAFADYRPALTPQKPEDCEIAGASDAALQMQLRALSQTVTAGMVPAVHVMLFRSTPWASQQKSRVSTFRVPGGDDRRLRRFKDALAYLKPRVATKIDKVSTGRGKDKKTTEVPRRFWANSLVRPLVADNLARDKPWYVGFAKLMSGPDHTKLGYEREGLIQMTKNNDLFDNPGDQALVQCVQTALRSRYGKIAAENEGNVVAMRNRFGNEFERWRMAFAGAKTGNQFRGHFADFVSRGGSGNKALQQDLVRIWPLLKDACWQQARDLSLLALAGYESTSTRPTTEKEPE